MKRPGGGLVVLARITKTQGLKGAFRAFTESGESENLGALKRLFIKDAGGAVRPFEALSSRRQKSFYIIHLAGIETADAAQSLVGAEILCEAADIAQLPEGEFYWFELVGLRVLTHDGRDIGVVSGLFATGANDVLVVKDGDRERLIPYIDDAIAKVDTEKGLLVLNNLEGLDEL